MNFFCEDLCWKNNYKIVSSINWNMQASSGIWNATSSKMLNIDVIWVKYIGTCNCLWVFKYVSNNSIQSLICLIFFSVYVSNATWSVTKDGKPALPFNIINSLRSVSSARHQQDIMNWTSIIYLDRLIVTTSKVWIVTLSYKKFRPSFGTYMPATWWNQVHKKVP